MFENINEIAVLVAAIIAAAVGSIWYSPLLFGIPWMKAIGLTFEDADAQKNKMILAVVQSIVMQIIFFFVLAQFIEFSRLGAVSLSMMGVLLTVVYGAQLMSTVIWEKKPLSYMVINTAYVGVIIFAGIGIIAYWPW